MGERLQKVGAFCARYWNGDGQRRPWFRRIFAILFAFLVVFPVILILIFRFVPIPGTPQMLVSLLTGEGAHYSWRSGSSMPSYLGRGVIGAEDQLFCAHDGFDWKNIEKAWRASQRNPRKTMRGASTISQQTARSLFLLNTRSWVRKGMEAYLTVLIEALWPKKRILTVYLNVVDWGHGNFGADAAARDYFGVSASALSRTQAARLAAVLPNPSRWSAARPGPYVRGRTDTLQRRMWVVARDGLDTCVR